MVDEIAQMLNEDAIKKGFAVKPWGLLNDIGRDFWRAQAEEFISSVEG